MIMKYERNLLKNFVIAGCLVLAVFFCSACKPEKNDKPGKKPVMPVTVAQSMEKEVPVQLKAIGTVEAYATVVVKSLVNGQIARVHFEEGSDVEKGDLLVSIDPAPFLATLGQYEAALAKNRAQEKFAREQADRYAGLLKEGIVAQDQYDLLRTNADSLAAAVNSDLAAIKSAKIQLSYCSIHSPISEGTGTLPWIPGTSSRPTTVPS
jgi:multidrug efflux system membrane fusion protein